MMTSLFEQQYNTLFLLHFLYVCVFYGQSIPVCLNHGILLADTQTNVNNMVWSRRGWM